MLKKYIICLVIGIFSTACATVGDNNQISTPDTAATSATQQENGDTHEFQTPDRVPSSDWRSFKGVLLRHIVANCCFSDSQNTVILGQDNNSDGRVDKCYQLRGVAEKIYYRTIECPKNLAPVTAPQRANNLHCNLLGF